MQVLTRRKLAAVLVTLLLVSPVLAVDLFKKKKEDPQQIRDQYLHSLLPPGSVTPETHTLGSLWVDGGALADFATDYKAHKVDDILTIVVSVNTSSQQTGNLTSQRTFQTQSAITGVAGGISTASVNPLLAANSATTLKGQGQTANNSTLLTNLTSRVIAVLPNSYLVVEAQRDILMNNQRETMIVRGVVRPGDIAPNNTVASSALANLQIEMKGKGIVSDSTRPPNRITRAILRVLGF